MSRSSHQLLAVAGEAEREPFVGLAAGARDAGRDAGRVRRSDRHCRSSRCAKRRPTVAERIAGHLGLPSAATAVLQPSSSTPLASSRSSSRVKLQVPFGSQVVAPTQSVGVKQGRFGSLRAAEAALGDAVVVRAGTTRVAGAEPVEAVVEVLVLTPERDRDALAVEAAAVDTGGEAAVVRVEVPGRLASPRRSWIRRR